MIDQKAHHDPEGDYSGMVVDGPSIGQWLCHWTRTYPIRYLPPVRSHPSQLDYDSSVKDATLYYRYVDPSDGEGGVWKMTDESRDLWRKL